MREIKFRAWDEQKKVMHENFQFIKSGDEGNDWVVFTSNLQTLQSVPHPLQNPYFQQQLKVMQFTGLKDANGVDVYEGDVIARKDDIRLTEVVEWGTKKTWRGMADGYNVHHIGFNIDEYFFQIDSFVVIGNIYQNPELLK